VPRLSIAELSMLLVCLIWGTNFSVTKLALAEIPPLAFTALRFGASSVLMWAILRLVEGPVDLPDGSWRRLVLLGVVGNTLYQLGFILGLDRTTASNSALLLAAMPTVVTVMAGVLGLERITARMRWGTAIATAGVVLVVVARGVGFSRGTLSGDLLTVAAVLCWAAYTLGLRTLPASISPLRVTALTALTGTPGLVLAGLPELARLDWGAVGAGSWAALAYSSLLSLVLAYLIWNTSVRNVGPSRTSIFMCVTPLVAVAAAWLLLGERPVPMQGIGAVLIVAGVLLSRRVTRKLPSGDLERSS
jgi:drug/metabolite transporter (DMT)-like permease